MKSVLIINEDSRDKISKLREYSEANVFSKEDLLEIVGDPTKAAGNRDEFVCNIDMGYRVVYTVEEHPQKDGGTATLRHVSVSHGDKLPNELVIKEIIKEFGFYNNLEQCIVYLEGDVAVNILEPFI